MSEPAEPLPEPLFVEPVLDPLTPPRADLAAVPVRPRPQMPRPERPGSEMPRPERPGSELPGLEVSGSALSGALLSGAVLLEGTNPDPTAPRPLTLRPATPEAAAPGAVTAQPAATETPAPKTAAPDVVGAEPAAPADASTQARPQAGHVVAGRGVTGRGVVVLILILTGLVGLLEVAFAGHRGAAFAFVFVFTSAVGALVVRRRDLPTSIVAPPLLYCVLIAALSIVDTHDQSGGFITRKAIYIGNAFATGAPTLWAGTAAAAAIVWYRHRAGRAPRG